MNHLRLYNDIREALKDENFERVKELAEGLEQALKSSMKTYGWHKLPLSGHEGVDAALRRLDPYLTGDR